jgi:hypothetical protein
MIGDDKTLSLAAPHINAFLDSLPVVAGSTAKWAEMLTPQNEALIVPTQVCTGFRNMNVFVGLNASMIKLLYSAVIPFCRQLA